MVKNKFPILKKLGPWIMMRVVSFRSVLAAAALLAVMSATSHPSYAAPTVYAAYPNEPASTAFASVTVGGTSVGVKKFSTLSNPAISYSRFAMPASAHTIVITVAGGASVTRCSVKPAAYGISTTKSGSTCRFTLSTPRKLKVLINSLQWLYIFADPVETGAPTLDDPKVFDVTNWSGVDKTGATKSTTGVQDAINAVSGYNDPASILYFPNGKYWVGQLNMKSNVTLYLQSGAIIKGSTDSGDYSADSAIRAIISFNGVSNAGINGRGVIFGDGLALRSILCGANNTRKACSGSPHGVFVTNNSSAVTVKDVYIMDTAWRANFIHYSDNVTSNGIKIVNEQAVWNTGGVIVDSSTNVTARDVFYHGGDDAFCVKSINYNGQIRPSNNVRFENNVIGTGTRGAKLGTETKVGGDMTNTYFTNIIAMHLKFEGVNISLKDGNTIDGVTFDGINTESAGRRFLLEIVKRTSSSPVGTMQNVSLKNISMPSKRYPSPINGFDETHKISNVTICNYKEGGVTQTSLADANIVPNSYTTGITFSQTCP